MIDLYEPQAKIFDLHVHRWALLVVDNTIDYDDPREPVKTVIARCVVPGCNARMTKGQIESVLNGTEFARD